MTVPLDPRHALIEAERCLQCSDAPCTAACPAHIDVPRFIHSIRTGNYLGAAQVVRGANALAHVCGCVCPQEVFCQAACTRGKQDSPVEIRGLHRFVTELEARRGYSLPAQAPPTGRIAAVIGAGPAGLACAFELALQGIQTTVFERSSTGGVPAASIPLHRLSREDLRVDIRFLERFFTVDRSEVTAEVFERLRFEHVPVFVSVGLGRDRIPPLPGHGLEGVLPVLEFLEHARRTPDAGPPGRRIVVIGGGNVSLDAATTARRQGAEQVVLLYRRGEQEMRVWKAELEEARKAGVELRLFTMPVEILGEKRVRAIRCRSTRAGNDLDATGRRVPEEIPGSEFTLEADAVVLAIGQIPAAEFLEVFERTPAGYLRVDEHYRTSVPGVYAGGDVVGGEGTVVQAVAQGKAAARAMAEPHSTPGTHRYPRRDLSYEFLGLRLENPFILAAGPSTDNLDMLRRAFTMGWAGGVLKTTSIEGNRVDLAYPMMSGFAHEGKPLFGMGNIDLISEHHIDVVEERVRVLKKEFPEKMVAASIMAGRQEDWQRLVERLERAGADLVECSFSCPQGNIGEDPGKMLAQSIQATETTARWVKEASRKIPVAIKITPHVTDIVEVARAVKRSGCDALTASNSIQALMGVDIRTFTPYPQLGGRSAYSGLTGPAIKPITLRTIAEIARHVRLPILGTGGASTWGDAVEFMAVGAGLVQFCTAVMHHGFGIIDDLCSGMALYLEEMRMESPQAIVGRALPQVVAHDDLPRREVRSRINESACIGCEVCYRACMDGGHQAMDRRENRIPAVDDQRCVGCGLCVHVCPELCITLEEIHTRR